MNWRVKNNKNTNENNQTKLYITLHVNYRKYAPKLPLPCKDSQNKAKTYQAQ